MKHELIVSNLSWLCFRVQACDYEKEKYRQTRYVRLGWENEISVYYKPSDENPFNTVSGLKTGIVFHQITDGIIYTI